MSTSFHWAMPLCNCSGTPNNRAAPFFFQFVSQRLGEYWADMSFGEPCLEKSYVFTWELLPITTQKGTYDTPARRICHGGRCLKLARRDLSGIAGLLVHIDVPFIGQNITEGGQPTDGMHVPTSIL